jgi:hypothetical protein
MNQYVNRGSSKGGEISSLPSRFISPRVAFMRLKSTELLLLDYRLMAAPILLDPVGDPILSILLTYSVDPSEWTLFAAGAVPDAGVRNSLIEMVRKRATLNVTNSNIGSLGAFPTAYDVTSGKTQSGAAR